METEGTGRGGKKNGYMEKAIAGTLVLIVLASLVMMYLYSQREGEAKFTEIYLVQNSHPEKVGIGMEFGFQFEINNKEGKDAEYDYLVGIDRKGEGSGKSVFVKSGEQKTISESTAIYQKGRHKIFINLKGKWKDSKELELFFIVDVS